MTNFATIETLVRSLINDIEVTSTDVFVYTTNSIFTLTEKNVNSIVEVIVNGATSGVTYTTNTATGRLNVTSALSVDDVVEITYKYYSNYSTTEINSYIKSALSHIALNGLTLFAVEVDDLFPTPTDPEINLIAMVTSILINPSNISYRMPDISVSIPKDLNTFDKIRKAIAIFKKDSSGFMFIAEDRIFTPTTQILGSTQ